MSQAKLAAVALAALLVASIARADDPEPNRIHPAASLTPATPTAPQTSVTIASPGQVQATPDMWFYQQELARYNNPNPKALVRAAAEEKSAQRRARIAAMQWYGYSNSRPTSGIDPVNGPISPQWVGNGYNSYYWVQPSIWVLPGMARGY
jgi:hypothetical protein